MCGVFFSCCDHQHVVPDDVTQDALCARGPDSWTIFSAKTNIGPPSSEAAASDKPRYLTWASSVLSLRGNDVCVQPLIDPATGSALCWNGEAWKVNGAQVQGSDTDQVFQLMLNAVDPGTQDKKLHESCLIDITRALTCVAGPYAFVFYHAPTSLLYYGRDRLGRRSLVWKRSSASLDSILISSLCLEDEAATEVSTDGVHYLDLKCHTLSPGLIPWPTHRPIVFNEVPNPSQLTRSAPSTGTITDFTNNLAESLRLRIVGVPRYTLSSSTSVTTPSRIAILFSGGLDCTLLARIAHDVLPIDQPIDLLNVAFENPRTIRAAARSANANNAHSEASSSPFEACPDRVTARSSFAELSGICPTRLWRFVAIDVPYAETLTHRPTIIKLMSPHNTEMDLSIALALYFASRGQGLMTTSFPSATTPAVPYTTTSRVLLSGLGADELFGGYTRHAAAFSRSGFAGLTAELDLDFARIGTRNLGRDDRVMAHWGREVRYPYLDEDFVTFALALPVWEKTGFRLDSRTAPNKNVETPTPVNREEDLEPAKMLLRLAAWQLGLRGAAAERKRAIQFGARTAKMEAGRTKGTDVLVA